MKLDTNTINKIAKLARIKLSEQASKDLLKDMNSILDWVEQLNEVDTDKIEPLANISSSSLPKRKDQAEDINSSDIIYKEMRKSDFSSTKIKKKLDQQSAAYILQGYLDRYSKTI